MRFSAFAPLSLYRLRSGEPRAKQIYKSLIDGLGGEYNVDPGSSMEGMCFAQALGLARAEHRIDQAVAQRLPRAVSDLMPVREREYGLIPAPTDRMSARRAAFAAKKRVPPPWTKTNIELALTDLLGADFLYYRPTPISEQHVYPPNIGDQPMNLQRADITRKAIQLTEPVSFIGVPSTVTFSIIGLRSSPLSTGNTRPVVGDVFVFDVGQSGQEDRVTITAVSNTIPARLTAIFTRPHSPGVMGWTHPLPLWQSTKLHSLIVLKPSAAADPIKRAKIHAAMPHMAEAVSTWDIVAGDSSTTVAFALGTPCMGFTTLPALALP